MMPASSTRWARCTTRNACARCHVRSARAAASLARAAMDPFAAPKRKRDYESGADVLSSTLSRLESEAASAAAAATARPFVASAAWAGARPGYVFGRGAQGQGYYADRAGGGSTAAAAPPPAAEVRRGCACARVRAAKLALAMGWPLRRLRGRYRRGVARVMSRSARARRWLLRRRRRTLQTAADGFCASAAQAPPPQRRVAAPVTGAQLLAQAEREAGDGEARTAPRVSHAPCVAHALPPCFCSLTCAALRCHPTPRRTG